MRAKKKHSQPARIWAREKKNIPGRPGSVRAKKNTFPAGRDQCARKKIPSRQAGGRVPGQKKFPGQPLACSASQVSDASQMYWTGPAALPNALETASRASKMCLTGPAAPLRSGKSTRPDWCMRKKNIPSHKWQTGKAKNAKKYYFAHAREKKKHSRLRREHEKIEKCEKYYFAYAREKKNIPGRPGFGRAKKKHSRPPGISAREKKYFPC